MKRTTRRWSVFTAILSASAIALTGCSADTGNSGEGAAEESGLETPLRVYVTPTPQGDVLNYIQELADADESGLQLDIIESDGQLDPNELLASGDIDANLFQHDPYFTSWKAAHTETTNLENVSTVLVNIFGLYSDKFDSVEEIPEGAEILVPNEQTNLPRALFILQDVGLIELSYPESDGSAEALAIDESDIVSNPKNLKFVPTDTTLRAQALPDVAASFINGDIALSNGVDLDLALSLEEPENNPYANVLTTTTELKTDPRIELLVEYLTSDEVASYIDEGYDGFVLAAGNSLL
ncbi:MetQ/NlpA family ABC transporter substrate-binding protein [Humidisolicoccus flavus]|uniref:MetQ/NlpA family ABC transporter substrate-binding protein n=1 Tax=Humidisolicoccus flavus TaxID=3111414 RepID=UPI0032460E98